MRGLKDQKHKLGYGRALGQHALGVLQRGIHKGLSLVLSFCLAFQPLLLQAQALGARSPVAQESQGIKAADGVGSVFRPTVGKAGNDVPLIDIVRPNGQGLSHNKYDNFNVDTHGVILNNSTEEVSRSQLGGLVPGNGNLRYSGAAKVILNEVVSANRSRLEGVSEVHGHMADVIIANPNGITCNGCGFINTPRVTLSTGQPIIGADGALSGLRVEGGDITIGARGADGSALDIFDLVSRKISIGGPIQVKGDLAVIAGHNHFDYHKREATSLGSDGKEPELAIDSSEFGGMYAGQIRVLANDKGAGVKMRGDMVANAGAMRLTSDGKLVLAKARAKGAVKAHSHHDSVHVKDLLFSEEAVELKALKHVELAEQARVAASGAVDVRADVIKLQSHALLASGIGSDGQQSATGSLHLQAAKLEAGNGRIAAGDLLKIQAATIDLSRMQDNDQTGVSSLGDLIIETNQITALNNHIGAKGNIVLSADDALTVGAGHYSAGGSLLVEAAELTSRARLVAEQKIDLYAHHGALIQEGTVWSNGEITLDAHGALNHTGDIVSMQQVALTAGGMLTTSQESTILSYDVVLSADALTQAGTVEAQEGALTLQVRDGVANSGTMRGESVDAHIGAFTNQGTFIATDDLHLMVSAQEGVDPQQAFLENTSEGVLQSGGAFVVIAGRLDNAGVLGSSGESVALNVAGNVSNSGLIYAKKSMDLFSDGNLTNTQGRIIAEEALSIGGLKETRAGHINNEAGLLSALAGEMKIVATSFVNKSAEATNSDQQNATHDEGAHVLARDGLRIDVGSFENVDGLISTQGAVNIVADSVIQAGHIEIERGDLQLTSHGDLSNSGTIESNGAITVNAQNTLNQTGRIVSQKRIELSTDGTLTLGETSEVGAYDVALKAGILAQAGLIEVQGEELTLESHGDLTNSGTIASNGAITVRAQNTLNQTGRIVSQKRIELSTDGTLTLGETSQVGGYDVALKAGTLTQAGLIEAQGEELTLESHDDLTNSGTIASNGAITVNAQNTLNQTGRIVAQERIELSTDGTLTLGETSQIGGYDVALKAGTLNQAGLIEAQGEELTLESYGDLTNSGMLASNGVIALRAQNTLNQTGRIVAQERIELSTDGTLTLGETSKVAAYMDVVLKADTLNQAGLVEAQGGVLTLNSHGVLSNSGIMVGGVVDAKLGSLANSGQLLASDSFTLIAESHDPSLGQAALVLNGEDGVLKSGGAFVLTADVLDNAGSIGSSGDGVALNVSADLSNSGLIYAKKSAIFSLDGDFINNFADVIAEDNLIIRGLSGERAGHVINSSGLLEAVSGDMTFDVSALTNVREGGVEVTDKVVSHSYVRGKWENIPNVDKHTRIKKNIDTTIIRQQPHFTNNAAQILVGRHLTINAGDIRNSYSLIAANGNIVMHGDTLLNEGRDLIETTKIVTETRYRHKQCSFAHPACIGHDADEWDGPTFIQTPTRTYDAVYGTIEAGGTLDVKVTDTLDNHAVRDGAGQIGLSSGNKGLTGVKNTDVDGFKPSISYSSGDQGLAGGQTPDFDGSKPLISNDRLDGIINGLKGHKGLFAPSTKTPAPESIQVPTQDGLNSVKTELAGSQSPDVPFLIETRQDFINPSKFLGSDYYLKKIGNYKPEHVFKRLGDAYFEYRLVGEQIFELTGNRTLLDVEDPNAQMQRLYDNAVEQQGPLGLVLGKPLTPQQIAGIKKDMIWLETHLVDGQEVLVPHVYLVPNTSLAQDVYGAKTQQGNLASARLKGNGVTLNADRLTNSGAVVSDDALHVSTTQTLFNNGGFLLGTGAVELTSNGLLANSSGVIHGDTVTMTGDTIVNSTAKIRDTNAYGFGDRAGQKGQILSNHELNIQSLGDLGAEGGEFTSGGPMTMIIGGSATFSALALESEHAQTLEKGHYNAQSREHRLSEVNSGDDLNVVTNDDLIMDGVKVKGEGNGNVTSGGAFTLTSVQDVNSFDLDLRGKEGDKSKQKNKFRQQSTEVTTNKSTVEFSKDLSMHAQNGDLTLGAAGLSSGGEMHLASDKGKIKFLTNKDQDFKDVYQRNENLVWWSEGDEGYLKETIEHVTIDAKGGMKLDAGNGFVVEYEATGDLDKSLEQLSHSPGLAWIKQLRDDPELSKQVDWQAVKAEFKDWDYKAQGLTEAGAALVALAVTAVTGGAASGAASAITGALGLGSSTAMNAAIQAGVQALINKSAVALVNNRGNIAGALHELGSSKNILSIVSSMLTAGLTSQITEMVGVGQSLPKTAPFVDRIALEAEKNLIKAAIGTGVQTALEGGSLDKNFFNNLRIALSDTVGKSLAEEIGTAKAEGKIDTVTQIVAHAGLGCLKGAVASGACSAGAIGGAVGEATAMLQFKLSTKNFIQKEIAALDGRVPTAEEQARINAKIEAQFSDFNDHAIDIARIAGGFAAALAGGDVNTGADAAGNAAENNFLPAVAAAVAFIVSLTPQELAALSLFMAGGATIVQSPNNRTAIADFLTYWFASKNSAEDSEKTNQNSQEEKNKDSQKESKNKKKNGNNKEPQNNNDGKGNILAQVRKHHDKKRDEKKQELRDEGCIVCETEIVFKTKTDKGVVRSRADIVGIKDGKLFAADVKTGKADLSGNQKILKEAYKEGNAEPTKGKLIEFFKENKEFLEKYQESFKDFKGSDKKLNEANKEWIKEQLNNKLDKMDFYTFHYPGLFE
ncbi:DUF637 domain-containing protein [Bartonella grahamii]|uniref:Filamentous hemagglutinin n=2 Tax=Bartonella grahamii TaxID=33045 RepID=A0A336NC15_BARGR|nr:DUF637 domain-containing protein [Bartonella grahamii]SSZ39239.1 Filamentous hemagglutinin [Bartonella grahamii]